MAVSTKGRRKITVGGRPYVWFVSDNDEAWWVLTVISSDKKFLAKYALHQNEGEEYAVILGKQFAGAETGGSWRRFLCPRFATEAVTPGDVRRLIEWCLDERLPRQEIDWKRGNLMI